jgi:hypothetical protein
LRRAASACSGRERPAQPDREPVAAQVAELELALGLRPFEHADALLEKPRVVQLLRLGRQGQGLARDRMRVLEARVADRAVRHADVARETLHELQRPDAALLDPEPDVLTLPARSIGRDLVDDEVVVLRAQNRARARVDPGCR